MGIVGSYLGFDDVRQVVQSYAEEERGVFNWREYLFS